MKKCEICKSTARIYCDSDCASLCWTCDAKVHSANFLVAKHSRSLLCIICQSPTTWTAIGEKLSPCTSSICGNCAVEGCYDHDDREERVGGNGGETDSTQAMTWNSTPPPAASSSDGEGLFTCKGVVKPQRKRQNVIDLTFEDELDCSSDNKDQHKTTSYHSTVSSSKANLAKIKKLRHRSITFCDYMSAPVDTSKSIKIAEVDLNLSL